MCVYDKGKGSCLESRLHDNACSTDCTFPLARWAPMQPATIDQTLDLCTRYPLRLGGPRQCGIRSLPNTSTDGQHWESNLRPSDLESNVLSTRPHVPMVHDANRAVSWGSSSISHSFGNVMFLQHCCVGEQIL